MRTPLLLVLIACGCRYTWGSGKTQERTPQGDLPRVAVVTFDNDSFRRELEIRLTRQVADELRARAPQAAAPLSKADWILTGRIVAAGERVLSETTEDTVRQSSFWMTVEVTLKEQATEKVLRTYSLTESEPFSPIVGRIRTLPQAEEQVLRDLAERIVYGLEAPDPRDNS
ncbi:MAG: LPS assembly lipoprotein LptE [Planctomycetota bacterium]|nr:LPS assembly lipoprotein LptE [Planctomycetota bacterium]